MRLGPKLLRVTRTAGEYNTIMDDHIHPTVMNTYLAQANVILTNKFLRISRGDQLAVVFSHTFACPSFPIARN